MQYRATNAGERPLRRRGFTLVELLIVVAIIAVLAALSTSAAMAMLQSQHQKNTKFIMRQLVVSWNKQYTEVIKAAETEAIPPTVVAMANGDMKLARVLYIKFRLKQEFPVSFAEALNNTNPPNPAMPYNPLPPKPSYTALLGPTGLQVTQSATPLPYESSVCMYLSLTQSRNGTRLNAEQMASAIQEVAVGNGKAKMFVDDWHYPLIFCRWATGDTTLDALDPIATTTSKLRDPADPQGLLLNNTWRSSGLGLQFQNPTHGHSLTKAGAAHAYYLIPVIMSGGGHDPNELNEPLPVGVRKYPNYGVKFSDLTVVNPAALKSNIYSYNLDIEKGAESGL